MNERQLPSGRLDLIRLLKDYLPRWGDTRFDSDALLKAREAAAQAEARYENYLQNNPMVVGLRKEFEQRREAVGRLEIAEREATIKEIHRLTALLRTDGVTAVLRAGVRKLVLRMEKRRRAR